MGDRRICPHAMRTLECGRRWAEGSQRSRGGLYVNARHDPDYSRSEVSCKELLRRPNERVQRRGALCRVRCNDVLGGPQLRRHEVFLLPSRLIPHHHRSRAELQPAHEPQVDPLR